VQALTSKAAAAEAANADVLLVWCTAATCTQRVLDAGAMRLQVALDEAASAILGQCRGGV
jgi:hypothetical protein